MMLSAGIYHNLLFCHFRCILCVDPMSLMSTCFMSSIMPSLQRYKPCIFVIYVVTRTCMQSRLHKCCCFQGLSNSTKSSTCLSQYAICSCWFLVILPLLRMISKDVLLILSCSIHPCLCLQLWSTLAWVNRALLLLFRESGQIVYLLAILPSML